MLCARAASLRRQSCAGASVCLCGGRSKGDRIPLKELHKLVKEDEELQALAADEDEMASMRERYGLDFFNEIDVWLIYMLT